MSYPEYQDYCWLAEKPARTWLERLACQQPPAMSLLRQLRQEVGVIRAALLNQQLELRKRARQKFTDADQMLFTDQGLQQATDERVAAHKAARFETLDHVADLCCGIGGDLTALAARPESSVVGVDRDPVVAWIAQHNCQLVLGENATVSIEVADVREFDTSGAMGLHLDPDRRPGSRRHSQMQGYEPGPEFIEKHVSQQHAMALKLAPAATIPPAWQASCERQWITSRGECRQQVLWCGPLATAAGFHTATYLGPATSQQATVQGLPDQSVPDRPRCGRYLYEPHAAILAAGLVGAVAEQFELAASWSNVAYLSSDQYQELAGFACFEVEEVMPFDRKRIKSLLRQRNIGRLEVKKRGTQIDPGQLQQQLQAKQAGQATLLLAGTPDGVTAILAKRRGSPGLSGPLPGAELS